MGRPDGNFANLGEHGGHVPAPFFGSRGVMGVMGGMFPRLLRATRAYEHVFSRAYEDGAEHAPHDTP